MKKRASIDIGTNTVRLLILQEGPNGHFTELGSARRITRLGEGMNAGKTLLDPRMESTLSVLSEFRDICRTHGTIPIRAVATSAVREASNGEEFVRRALARTGIKVEVISWEEEAGLTLEGVFWKIPPQDRKTLTFDIGGGSTEFILSRGKSIVGAQSTSLGTVRLTEKFITRHPIAKDEYEHLQAYIQAELAGVTARLSGFQPELLIGTAGTVTTLAALQENIYPYDPEKIHGAVLSRNQIQRIQNDLKGKSIEERRLLKPLEPGRADLIIAGTAIVLETMRAFQCDLLTVSEYGLREGILLKALE